ncbi:MAG: beta-1,6-N-acetylglucosaminyltransferase [Arcticibacter sp.]
MQVAHIIMAHKDPLQVKRLVDRLLHPGCSVFIHVDRSKAIEPFREVITNPQVRFVERRIKVNWGGFSQVQAFIHSMAECMECAPETEYINFLSGQDYPLRSMSELQEFLSLHSGAAFMEYVTGGDPWLEESRRRIAQYHITDYTFPGQYKLEKLINYLMPKRQLPAGFELVGRSQWFTIDSESVRYILDVISTNKPIVNAFKHSWGADELFFQSILYNSSLKPKLVNDNLRYIDWSAAQSSPKVLTIGDAEALIRSGKFFARKFDSLVDEEIMDYIDSKLVR